MAQPEREPGELDIRVKDRGNEEPPSGKKKIGGIFKDSPMKGLLKDGAAESLRRPLSGLFRRPGSKAGRRKEEEDDTLVAQPPPNFSQNSRQLVTTLEDFSQSEPPAPPSSHGRSKPSTDLDANLSRAPRLSASNIPGIMQVDVFTSKYPQLTKLDDLDISQLTRYLYFEEDTKDEDIPWSWDYLFASVSTEMREEWAQYEEHD